MLCSFRRMLFVFAGRPSLSPETLSLVLTTPRHCRGRAVLFSELRDALAAIPSGLREARRVLGAAPSAYARRTYFTRSEIV
jgi:hypothetical protein